MYVFFKTLDEKKVYLTERSWGYIQKIPRILGLLEEAFPTFSLPQDSDYIATLVEFGRKIGETDCIFVSPDATLWFARYKNKNLCQVPLRVVEGEKLPSSNLTIIVVRDSVKWLLKTAWIGELAPLMPHDPKLIATRDPEKIHKSFEFWKGHALIHDPETMDEPFQTTWEDLLQEK